MEEMMDKKIKIRGLSIFHKLLIAFLSVVIVVSVLMIIVFYVFSKQSLGNRTQEHVLDKFAHIDMMVESRLKEDLVEDLSILAASPLLDEFLMSSAQQKEIVARSVERLFLKTLSYNDSFAMITFADFTGREIIKVGRAGRRKDYQDLSDSKLFVRLEKSTEGSIDIDGPYLSPANQPTEVKTTFSVGIHKSDLDIGEFGGMVKIDYLFDDFLESMEKVKIVNENPIWVFTPSGKVLKQPGSRQVQLDPRGHMGVVFQDVPAKVKTDAGLVVYQDFYFVPKTPFIRVAISIPEELLLGDLNRTLNFLAIVFCLSILITSLFAYYLSAYFARPIVKLSAAAVRLAKGDLSAHVGIKASGEVGILIDSFNRMAVDIKKTTVSRDYVDNIIRSMNETLIVVSPDGKISSVNQAVCMLLGYEEHELVGQPFEFVVDIDQSGNDFSLGATSSGTGISNVEMKYLAKDGRKIPAMFSAAVLVGSDGEIQGSVCLAQDISDRKQAEEENIKLEARLRRAQKLEAIGTLAGGIAHDFNNILTVVIGNAYLALDEIPEDNPARENVASILRVSDRAKNLVIQILAFSRITDQEKQPIKAHVIIKETLKLLRATIPTSIEIVQDIDPECGTINADPTQIHQIMMNLCTNAVHAMDDHGTLEISLKNVDLGKNDLSDKPGMVPGPYVRLLVSDTGVGMTKETLERIFDPFFTTKEVGKGTGMGLSVVHGIVETHNAVITVASEPGKGTSFYLFFPRVELEEIKPAEQVPVLMTGNERILFVDDEEGITEMWSQTLGRLGYQVTTKTSSTEAFDVFRSKADEFDIVITDQAMPGLTGTELAREILKIRPDMPIILCSGFSSEVSRENVGEFGIREFVMKPLNREKLAGVIRKTLDQER